VQLCCLHTNRRFNRAAESLIEIFVKKTAAYVEPPKVQRSTDQNGADHLKKARQFRQ
jgi:hypothetical protein